MAGRRPTARRRASDTAVATGAARRRPPAALVLGDESLAKPLTRAGVPVTMVAHRRAPARFTRLRSGWLPDPRPDEDALVTGLLRHADTLPDAPVLYYQQDTDLLFASRHRGRLAGRLRFVLPDGQLVEQLVDKGRFQLLARRRGLAVPPGAVVPPTGSREVTGLRYPLVVKPLCRDGAWRAHAGTAKALAVHDAAELEVLLDTVAAGGATVLVQQLVAGAESRIESYHVYVDAAGNVAGEFTGRKLRTYPRDYGHSTALCTTDAPDVVRAGRQVVDALGLRGVAKLDFKRDDTGRLWLLEVNPRFTLWHHVGAVAGVNIPAMVHADLTGVPRPSGRRARAGLTWAHVPRDWAAARSEGWSTLRWLRWLRRCAAVDGVSWDDPMPVLAGRLPTALRSARGAAR